MTKTQSKKAGKVSASKRKSVKRKKTNKRAATKKKVSKKPRKRAAPKTVSKPAPTDEVTRPLKDTEARWVILELAEDTCLEHHADMVLHALRSVLGADVEVFLPVYTESVQGKKVSTSLFDGYAFVKESTFDPSHIYDTCNEFIVGPVKHIKGYRRVRGAVINDFKRNLKSKIKDMVPKKKDKVVPRVGVFKNLEGEVLSVNKRDLIATVRFRTSSRVVDARVNIVNLMPAEGC